MVVHDDSWDSAHHGAYRISCVRSQSHVIVNLPSLYDLQMLFCSCMRQKSSRFPTSMFTVHRHCSACRLADLGTALER
jgi:hypothetical protein